MSRFFPSTSGKVKAAALQLVDSLCHVDAAQAERLKGLIRGCGRKLASRQRRFGRWKWTNYWMNVLGAVLAAVAGATALGKLVPTTAGTAWWLSNLPGLLAISAAVLTAIATGLDPSARAVRIGIERGSWGVLHSDVLAFTSQAARRSRAASDESAINEYASWFGSHLDDLERRFARQEAEDAVARKPSAN